ncbi:unnamed protein product [Sympodiomycopsis kandeliae]
MMDSGLHSASSPTGSEASVSSSSSSLYCTSHTGSATPPSSSTPLKPKRKRGDPEDPARKARLVARQARNRASAQNSRDRKKQERESLESEVSFLRERNGQLEGKVSDMQKGISALMDLVKLLMKDKQQSGPTPPVADTSRSQDATSSANASVPSTCPIVAQPSPVACSSSQPSSSWSADQTLVESFAAPDIALSSHVPSVASSSRSIPALSGNIDARHPTAMTMSTLHIESNKAEAALSSLSGGQDAGQRHSAASDQPQQHRSTPLGSSEASSDTPKGAAQPHATFPPSQAFNLDETNQRLACQLFETIFGHLGQEDPQQQHHLAQTASQSQTALTTTSTPWKGDLKVNEEVCHNSSNIKQEAQKDDCIAHLPLATKDPTMDAELINALVDMGRSDASLLTDPEVAPESSDSWTSSSLTNPSENSTCWDFQTLGLDLGLDLSVDLDLDLDSDLASSLGFDGSELPQAMNIEPIEP